MTRRTQGEKKNTNAVSHFLCYITAVKAARRGRPTPPKPGETSLVFITPVITQQTRGKTKRMGTAAKEYNSKATLLSIYKERLEGFTSGGKQVLACGGAIKI